MNQNSGSRPKIKCIARAAAALLFFLSTFAGLSAQTQDELQVFSDRLQFGEIEVKRNTLRDLRNIESESASRAAIPALRDISEVVRATAAGSVIFLPREEAVQVLLPLLDDKSVFVRREAAYALGKVGSNSAVRKLIVNLSGDREMEVKTACAVALGEIGDVSAVPELTDIVSKKQKDGTDFLRRAAARSIGKIAQFIQHQTPTSTTPESFLPEKYKRIGKPKYPVLTEAIPVFGNANLVLSRVIESKKETNDLIREAAFALGEIGDKSAIPVLQPLLRSSDYYLAEICEEALRKVFAAVNYSKSDSPSPPINSQN